MLLLAAGRTQDLGGFPEVSVSCTTGSPFLESTGMCHTTASNSNPPCQLSSPSPEPWIPRVFCQQVSEGPRIGVLGLPLNVVRVGFALENSNRNVKWLELFLVEVRMTASSKKKGSKISLLNMHICGANGHYQSALY